MFQALLRLCSGINSNNVDKYVAVITPGMAAGFKAIRHDDTLGYIASLTKEMDDCYEFAREHARLSYLAYGGPIGRRAVKPIAKVLEQFYVPGTKEDETLARKLTDSMLQHLYGIAR